MLKSELSLPSPAKPNGSATFKSALQVSMKKMKKVESANQKRGKRMPDASCFEPTNRSENPSAGE